MKVRRELDHANQRIRIFGFAQRNDETDRPLSLPGGVAAI